MRSALAIKFSVTQNFIPCSTSTLSRNNNEEHEVGSLEVQDVVQDRKH
uniref:Uncharacterized protein n=1 Tax=Arundo donax TaxID=35708 RepID=A0A0A9H3V9_ARUDO